MTEPKPTKTNTLNDILTERGASYGSFADNSMVAMELRDTLKSALHANDTRFVRKITPAEAVVENACFMIAAKLSRLVTGDTLHRDSWHDIAGYAELVVRFIDERDGKD